MFLSQYIKTDIKNLLKISPLALLFCISTQIALWAVLISQSQQGLAIQEKLRDRERKAWRAIEQQSHLIKSYLGQQSSELAFHLKHTYSPPNRLTIRGRASLASWQEALNSVQQHFSFGLISMRWENLAVDGWYGELDVRIKAPNKVQYSNDWLPVLMGANPFIQESWRLVSVIKIDTKVSALLQYKGDSHWVKEGDWLPSLGVMVHSVSVGEVTLFTQDGHSLIVSRLGMEGRHE